jgi:hypothetical protein
MSRKPTYGDAIGWLIAGERLDRVERTELALPDTVGDG